MAMGMASYSIILYSVLAVIVLRCFSHLSETLNQDASHAESNSAAAAKREAAAAFAAAAAAAAAAPPKNAFQASLASYLTSTSSPGKINAIHALPTVRPHLFKLVLRQQNKVPGWSGDVIINIGGIDFLKNGKRLPRDALEVEATSVYDCMFCACTPKCEHGYKQLLDDDKFTYFSTANNQKGPQVSW
jgi:hypothetical protein